MITSHVRSLYDYLRSALPLDAPTMLRIAASPQKDQRQGACNWTGQRYTIQLHNMQDTQAAIGVLVHEYAHALSWGMDADEPHGEMFKEALRVSFSSYTEWLKTLSEQED